MNKAVVAALMFMGTGCLAVELNGFGEYCAEDILNNKVSRKASPKAVFEFIDDGLAVDRIGKTPAPGVHPRILFSPDDMPDIRRRIKETGIGSLSMATICERNNRTIFAADSRERRLFELLLKGDIEGFQKASLEGKPTVDVIDAPPFLYDLLSAAFECLIADDQKTGVEIATVFTNYAKFVEPFVDQCNQDVFSDNFFRSGLESSDGPLGDKFFGYCYDFTYNWMTPEQRDICRNVIAKATYGKITIGMDLPAHWRNWNFVSDNFKFPLLALAIEGEEGYDARIYEKAVEVATDFLTYGLDRNGFATESIGFSTTGMVNLSEFMAAAARRENVLFGHSHYRNIPKWLTVTMQPYGKEWLSRGDLGNFCPSLITMQIMKYFYPDYMLVDYVYKNTLEASLIPTTGKTVARYTNLTQWLIPAVVFAQDESVDAASGRPVDYSYGDKLGLANTLFNAECGYLITRSNWSYNALTFAMSANTNLTYTSHSHADAGHFTFSSDGKAWSADDVRSPETKFHNSILIDGVGQGYYPTPGKWLSTVNTVQATFGVCDVKYCYDWLWEKTMYLWPADDKRFDTPYYEVAFEPMLRFREKYKDVKFEPDPIAQVVEYYDGYLTGDPKMWDEDSWVVRAPHNPVEYAFRTAGLIRGLYNYILTIDDIKKDSQQRLYQWTMMLPYNVDVYNIEDNDVILCETTTPQDSSGKRKPENGDRMLLVRVVGKASSPGTQQYSDDPSPQLEILEKKRLTSGSSIGANKRLTIGSRSVSPQFKVLIYPYKYGQALPQTYWNDDMTQLTIKWNSQSDVYNFATTPEGRTVFNATRNGGTFATVE